MADTMIATTSVRKSFGATPVLDGVDLEVPGGHVLALLGPNGAGKTTLVSILATLLRPDAGTATVGGFDVVRQARQAREVFSLTGQYAAVDRLLTGRENLRLMARLAHLGLAEGRRRADDLLELFELSDAADRLVRTYSGGMERRLDLAISLLTRPQVIFLDEPTTGLDPRSRNELWGAIRDVVAAGTTVLLTTQYLDEADALADRIAVLDRGRLIADGTAVELKRRVGSAHVALELVGGGVERIPTDGSVADVRRILGEVAGGPPITHWHLATPSLDDVFLTLTGAPAPSSEPADRASAPGATGPVPSSDPALKEAS